MDAIIERDKPIAPQITAVLELDQYERLRLEAFKRRVSISALVRQAVGRLISDMDDEETCR